MMDITLVTANFYFNDETRSLEKCIEHMKTLLRIPCYLVIYCNESLFLEIQKIRNDFGLDQKTHYIVLPFSSIWTYQYKEIVIKNRETYWPTRDVRAGFESHLLTNNKWDFVLQTIQTNPFHTLKFGWIDANIGVDGKKIAREFTISKFINLLEKVGTKFRIQIINVCDKQYKNYLREYYQQYRWVVCGCLFTLENNETNLKILQRLKEIFIHTTISGYGHGEEMCYLSVLDEFYDSIDRAYGDYQDIVDNFIEPRVNFHYIFHMIICRYFHFKYYRECYDVCKKVVPFFENAEIYSMFYISALHTTSQTEAENIKKVLLEKYPLTVL